MISLIVYELAVIALYLSLRALKPELFVGGTRIKAAAPAAVRRVRTRVVTPQYISRHHNDDPTRGAGMGMMIR